MAEEDPKVEQLEAEVMKFKFATIFQQLSSTESKWSNSFSFDIVIVTSMLYRNSLSFTGLWRRTRSQ